MSCVRASQGICGATGHFIHASPHKAINNAALFIAEHRPGAETSDLISPVRVQPAVLVL